MTSAIETFIKRSVIGAAIVVEREREREGGGGGREGGSVKKCLYRFKRLSLDYETNLMHLMFFVKFPKQLVNPFSGVGLTRYQC